MCWFIILYFVVVDNTIIFLICKLMVLCVYTDERVCVRKNNPSPCSTDGAASTFALSPIKIWIAHLKQFQLMPAYETRSETSWFIELCVTENNAELMITK